MEVFVLGTVHKKNLLQADVGCFVYVCLFLFFCFGVFFLSVCKRKNVFNMVLTLIEKNFVVSFPDSVFGPQYVTLVRCLVNQTDGETGVDCVLVLFVLLKEKTNKVFTQNCLVTCEK